MMIDLNDAKLHLRVDGNEENSIIQLYIDAALEKTSVILGRKLIAPSATPSDESEIAFNPTIKAACLLYVGLLYAHREAASAGGVAELPLGYYDLLRPYRLMGV